MFRLERGRVSTQMTEASKIIIAPLFPPCHPLPPPARPPSISCGQPTTLVGVGSGYLVGPADD